jgi:hypothetical protein
MRATWLIWPCLAALALTVTTGCHHKPRPARGKAWPVQVGVAVEKGEVRVDVKPAAPAPQPVADPPQEEKPVASWEVKGWGRNQAEAEDEALKKARQLVASYLRRREPPFAWTPSTTYVRKHLVDGPSRRLKEEDQPVGKFQAECWALPVLLTAEQFRAMVRHDRVYRVRQREAEREWRAGRRMVIAGKVTLGLLALIMGVAGYTLLDGRAGGAYTRGLRAGLGRVVMAPASGLRCLAGSKCRRGGPGA